MHNSITQQLFQARRKRPTQAFSAQDNAGHALLFEMWRNTAPGYFNFGEFWHGGLSASIPTAYSVLYRTFSVKSMFLALIMTAPSILAV
jgi:hypothetical protein